MSEYNSRTADKFIIRMPPGMREQVSERASEGFLSMNSWVLQAIAEKLDRTRRQELLLNTLANAASKNDCKLEPMEPSLDMLAAYRKQGDQPTPAELDDAGMGCVVYIRRVSDGTTVRINDFGVNSGSEYMWSEGNYSCDCNRHLFFQRRLGLPDDTLPACRSDLYLAQVVLTDGRILYDEFEDNDNEE